MLYIMRRNPDYPSEKALWKVLEYYGIRICDTDFLNLLETLRDAAICIAAYYREKVICTLLDAGIELHVYGESWDKAFFAEHKYLIRHPGINVEDSLRIMEQAKISLNVMSWHKDGFTERVLNSMLAKAVVVSDKSTRLEEEFVDGEDIILFNLAQINELPKRVKALLQDGERLKRIAESGAKKVIEKHLWIHRAKELLNIISTERPNT